jgi:acetyl esterase/lipase
VGLVVFDLEGGKPPVRAAQAGDLDIVNVAWVGEQRLVFGAVDLAAGSGNDRREAPGLFVASADGSEVRQLIARRSARVVESAPLARRALPWNHQLLKIPASRGAEGADEEIIVGRLQFARALGLEQVTPLWLNLRTGRTRSVDGAVLPGATRWLFDSTGAPRAAVSRDGTQLALHWRAPGQDGWQTLVQGERLRLPLQARFVDDAGGLYVSHPVGPEGRSVLSRYDFERRDAAREPFVSVDGFDFNGTLVTDEASGQVLGVRTEADVESTVWFEPAMQRLQTLADQRLPGRVNRLSCRRCGADDRVVLVRSWSDRNPGELWLYREKGARWTLVTRVMEGIEPASMATVDFQRIRARDGRDLPVWLTLPPGHRPGLPAPAVVLVHGGPWVRGGHWRWQPLEQFLASRGYVVISPEFRGSAGYGQAHLRAGWKQWGQAMQDDVADALLWAQAQKLVDERACIAGASYGGYATLMGLIKHPELYRCGVSWVGVSDLFLFLEGSFWVWDDITDLSRDVGYREMVGDTNTEAEALRAVSPIEQVERLRAPLLLAYGEADVRVPLAHGERLRDALRKLGREPEWVTYPNEAHSWRLPQTHADFARRVEAFLTRHLGPSRP